MADYARGERLRDLRSSRHLSQERFGHEVGVSAKTVRSWEQGGGIKWDNAVRVAEFLGVDAESLVSRDPEVVLPESGPLGRASQLDRIEETLGLILSALRALDEDALGRAVDDLGRKAGSGADEGDEGQRGSGRSG